MVVPARNAAAMLPSLLTVLSGRDVRATIVVDRASSDATGSVARDRGAIVLREPSGGDGAACLRALTHSAELPEPPEVVVFVPADTELHDGDLAALVDPIAEKDAELTMGVRRGGLPQKLALRLIEAVYRQRLHDAGPVRAIRFPALVALGMSDRADGWNVEMLVRALKLGLGILEVPVGPAGGAARERRGLKAAAVAGGRSLFHIVRHATVR